MTGARTSSEATRSEPAGVQRLDKWLWFARITKSRTLAAQLVQDGKVRVNRAKVAKPSQTVRPGRRADHRHPRQRPGAQGAGAGRAPRAAAGGAPALRGAVVAGRPDAGSAGAAQNATRGAGRPSKRDRRLTDRLTEQE